MQFFIYNHRTVDSMNEKLMNEKFTSTRKFYIPRINPLNREHFRKKLLICLREQFFIIFSSPERSIRVWCHIHLYYSSPIKWSNSFHCFSVTFNGERKNFPRVCHSVKKWLTRWKLLAKKIITFLDKIYDPFNKHHVYVCLCIRL